MNHHIHPPRRILPIASTKRKETELYSLEPSSTTTQPPTYTTTDVAAHPNGSNQLLAGYMAYEFLTTGTMFGLEFDPARVGAVPLVGASAYPRMVKPESELNFRKHESYAEVANILKTDEAHIPGIINPAQLARWIQM